MLTRQEAALQRQREREAREWRELVDRRRREEEQARREPRREGRYVVVVDAPSMYDPVPPPEEDIFWRQRLEASYEFPDQDVATSGDPWRGTIRRLQGLRHGPRTPRFRRENFDSLVPFVVPVVVAPRRRYRGVNAIMHGQAAYQEATESDDESQEQQAEDIDEGVAQGQGWQEEAVFKGAQDHGGWQAEVDLKGAQEHGWEEEEVGWQGMQGQYLDGIDTNMFLNLSDDGGDE